MNILFAAGGTGGHLFPAIAVAQELRSRSREHTLIFTGTSTRMESQIVPKYGFDFEPLDIDMPRGSLLQRVAGFAKLGLRSLDARALLQQRGIDAVVSAGSYITVPAGLAAIVTRTPLVLLEQNVVPGKANKGLMSSASAICLTFEETKKYIGAAARKATVTGNPVRAELLSAPERHHAKSLLGYNPALPLVLVVGGSLGARSINTALRTLAPALAAEGVQFLWQTGSQSGDFSALASPMVRCAEFIDDMTVAYAAADVVLARAGASTIAELETVARASVLVPLPTAADDHQRHNAEALHLRGASLVVEDTLLATHLEPALRSLLTSPEKRAACEAAVARPLHRRAAAAIADIVERAAAGKS